MYKIDPMFDHSRIKLSCEMFDPEDLIKNGFDHWVGLLTHMGFLLSVYTNHMEENGPPDYPSSITEEYYGVTTPLERKKRAVEFVIHTIDGFIKTHNKSLEQEESTLN